jgi:ActR/RegA family two-component response regulator
MVLLNHQGHQKNILLLDDDTEFAKPVMRWLRKAGYAVSLAMTLDESFRCLERERYHLAIVDIRLDDMDEGNQGGMDFLHIRDERGLREIMPAIVLTGNATMDNVLEAFTQYSVFSYIKKEPGYREKLLHEVNRAFEEEIQINFNLKYDEDSDEILSEVVNDIYWSERLISDGGLLACEAQDLFGKLFRNAESIYLTKLKPGLSGAGIVHVSPFWAETGLGPTRVVKVDRLDKSLKEKHNYGAYVKNSLPHATTQVSYAQSHHLGAALYSFAEDASVEFMEFDEYYQKTNLKDIKSIEESLHNLIFKTCRFWYDQTRGQRANLQSLYFQAFNLDRAKLVMRLQELMPDYDSSLSTLLLPGSESRQLNPLYWLKSHERECTLAVKLCITHGDMTGRNIMVDGSGKCWLIDFLRTYESHSLRDFVILETDLKYRLGPILSDQDSLDFEKVLILQGVHSSSVRLPAHWEKETRKLFAVIKIIRDLARQVGFGVANPNQVNTEYMISLLMATLNVVRLRHMPLRRKMQALRTAILICERLEES